MPGYVEREFDAYLKCGRLEHTVFCAFAATGATLNTWSHSEALPQQPMRQWVLSFPFPVRFLFASRPAVMGQVLRSASFTDALRRT